MTKLSGMTEEPAIAPITAKKLNKTVAHYGYRGQNTGWITHTLYNCSCYFHAVYSNRQGVSGMLHFHRSPTGRHFVPAC